MSVAKVNRVVLAIRISPEGLAAIEQRAKEDDRSRSDMARTMLMFAVKRMPKGWRARD